MVGRDGVFVEATDAEVIDADRADAFIDEVLGGFLGDVDEILIEGLLLPAYLRVAGAEEDAFALLELQLGQLGWLDGFLVLDLDDAAGADDGFEGEVVHRAESLEEMPRRVHVRARVGVQVED